MTIPYNIWQATQKCSGKIRWKRRNQAKRSAADSARAYGEDREVWSHYRCTWCGYWHVGHKKF